LQTREFSSEGLIFKKIFPIFPKNPLKGTLQTSHLDILPPSMSPRLTENASKRKSFGRIKPIFGFEIALYDKNKE
jgi:hypothetical protein